VKYASYWRSCLEFDFLPNLRKSKFFEISRAGWYELPEQQETATNIIILGPSRRCQQATLCEYLDADLAHTGFRVLDLQQRM